MVTASPGVTAAPLQLRDLRKSYRAASGATVLALEQVSVDVGRGEFVCIVGPSGCGKSTLLRLVAGLEAPDAGSMWLGSDSIDGPSPHRGLVFQDPNLFPWLTVRGNLESGLRAQGLLGKRRDDVDAMLQLIGLSDFAHHFPHQLSGGMAQRAGLARALVVQPRLLCLDEPLASLDAFTRIAFQGLLLRLWKERGTTLLMVTHDIDEAIALSQRIVVMTPRPGRVDQIIDVSLSHPRDRNSEPFVALRRRIMDLLQLQQQFR